MHILRLWNVYNIIWKVSLVMDYYSDATPILPSLLLTQKQIGRGALTLVDPLLGTVFS